MTHIRLIETCSTKTYEVPIGKYLSIILPIQNGLKQGDA